jgi:hypothetical protein
VPVTPVRVFFGRPSERTPQQHAVLTRVMRVEKDRCSFASPTTSPTQICLPVETVFDSTCSCVPSVIARLLLRLVASRRSVKSFRGSWAELSVIPGMPQVAPAGLVVFAGICRCGRRCSDDCSEGAQAILSVETDAQPLTLL